MIEKFKKYLKIRFINYADNVKAKNFKTIYADDSFISIFVKKIKKCKKATNSMNKNLTISFWNEHQIKFLSEINELSLKKFLRLQSIREVMFESYGKYLFFEYFYIKIMSYFKKEIRDKCILENSLGDPIPFLFNKSSSGNLIHHVYHITQLEKFLNISIKSIDFVYEYGGGYGSLTRAFFQNGFRGVYLIQDLLPFSLLQEFYLTALGLRVEPFKPNGVINKNPQVLLTTNNANKNLIHKKNFKKKIFIATWSLSEVDPKFREIVNDDFFNYDYYLIAFRDTFNGFDNLEYFHRITLMSLTKIEWNFVRMKHIPNSFYLFGKARQI